MVIISEARFLKRNGILFFTPMSEDFGLVLNNFREIIVEDNLATYVKIIDITTREGKYLAKKHDIPEVPCYVLGKKYYFRDHLMDKEKLKRVFKKRWLK